MEIPERPPVWQISRIDQGLALIFRAARTQLGVSHTRKSAPRCPGADEAGRLSGSSLCRSGQAHGSLNWTPSSSHGFHSLGAPCPPHFGRGWLPRWIPLFPPDRVGSGRTPPTPSDRRRGLHCFHNVIFSSCMFRFGKRNGTDHMFSLLLFLFFLGQLFEWFLVTSPIYPLLFLSPCFVFVVSNHNYVVVSFCFGMYVPLCPA